nr:hypothetical protein [Tanacetum cinerariifolium]
MGKALSFNRSEDPEFGDFIELNDLNEPIGLRNQEIKDLGPTIKDGEVIDELNGDIFKTRNDNVMVEKIDEYPSLTDFTVVNNMDTYRNECMGDVIVGKPFCRELYVEARRFNGFITIYNGNDNMTYQMARIHPRFKHLFKEQCNKIRPFLKVSARDKLEEKLHPYQKLKDFYKRVLNLGIEYIKDERRWSGSHEEMCVCMRWIEAGASLT